MFEELFESYVPDVKALEGYGFHWDGPVGRYAVELSPWGLELRLRIEDGRLRAMVWDLDLDEQYVLATQMAVGGAFVGQVREACQRELLSIREAGFKNQAFETEQMERILAAVKDAWQVEPAFLWERSPDAAVLRHPGASKWFAVVMAIDWSKLDPARSGRVEVINLKSDRVAELLKEDGFYPAFHMNKKYWVSLPLDETLSDQVVLQALKRSRELTKK